MHGKSSVSICFLEQGNRSSCKIKFMPVNVSKRFFIFNKRVRTQTRDEQHVEQRSTCRTTRLGDVLYNRNIARTVFDGIGHVMYGRISSVQTGTPLEQTKRFVWLPISFYNLKRELGSRTGHFVLLGPSFLPVKLLTTAHERISMGKRYGSLTIYGFTAGLFALICVLHR